MAALHYTLLWKWQIQCCSDGWLRDVGTAGGQIFIREKKKVSSVTAWGRERRWRGHRSCFVTVNPASDQTMSIAAYDWGWDGRIPFTAQCVKVKGITFRTKWLTSCSTALKCFQASCQDKKCFPPKCWLQIQMADFLFNLFQKWRQQFSSVFRVFHISDHKWDFFNVNICFPVPFQNSLHISLLFGFLWEVSGTATHYLSCKPDSRFLLSNTIKSWIIKCQLYKKRRQEWKIERPSEAVGMRRSQGGTIRSMIVKMFQWLVMHGNAHYKTQAIL